MGQLYVCGHAQWKAPFQVSIVPLYADYWFVHRAGGQKQNNVFWERNTV
jgi:hypothetical protein